MTDKDTKLALIGFGGLGYRKSNINPELLRKASLLPNIEWDMSSMRNRIMEDMKNSRIHPVKEPNLKSLTKALMFVGNYGNPIPVIDSLGCMDIEACSFPVGVISDRS